MSHIHASGKVTDLPPIAFRSDEEIMRFFDGTELVEPGLAEIDQWHPEWQEPVVSILHMGGVGRTPA